MTVPRFFVSILFAAALSAYSSDALACSCAYFGRPGAVVPNGSHPAPTNTRVYIFLNERESRPADELRAVLAEEVSGKEVPTAIEVRHSRDQQMIIVSPTHELAANTKYIVRWGDTGELHGSRRFFTGATADHKAPEWKGIRQALFRMSTWTADSFPHIVLEFDGPSDATRLRAGDVTVDVDDGSVIPEGKDRKTHTREKLERLYPAAQLLAVWIAESDRRIDYTSAPTIYEIVSPDAGADGRKASLAIGRLGCCGGHSYTLSEPINSVRVGVRPVDLAGNFGEASEARFEVTPDTLKVTPDAPGMITLFKTSEVAGVITPLKSSEMSAPKKN
jgi:hypothetical protein